MYSPVTSLFDTNPIDPFFLEMAHILVPTSTGEMNIFAQIAASAWFAEMNNAFDIMRNATHFEIAQQIIDEEREAFIEYVRRSAEVEVLLWASNAFSEPIEGEELFSGTIRGVIYLGYLREKWREKTEALFHRFDISEFVFCEEQYYEELRAQLGHLFPLQ